MRRLITILLTGLALLAIAAVAEARIPSPDPVVLPAESYTDGTSVVSPDARDTQSRPVTTYAPGKISPASTQAAVELPVDGFNWGDAGIGAAGMLALAALFGGALMFVSQRRRDRHPPFATH